MFIDNLKEELNTSITENGAEGYATTGKNLLDFNFKISSYRNKSDKDIIIDFKKVWYEDKELALKMLFYIRDIREGVGERRLFRVCIKEIANELDNRVFDWIAEYGRYDDLFTFINTSLEKEMLDYIARILTLDIAKSVREKSVSLLAKWMPSINTSSKETRDLAKYICSKWHMNHSTYRKTLSVLRNYIDVVERKLCANEWDKVDYQAVPSNANLKYKNAFLKHDEERRRDFIASLSKGEAKINSSVVFPHDIVHKYNKTQLSWHSKLSDYDEVLEQMWKGLPNYVNGQSKILSVRDGSGSMRSTIGNTNTTALDVATALTILFAQRSEGQFKDKFITFSSFPKLIDFSKYETLHDILNLCYAEDDCSNTNIEATFDLILKTAVNNKLKQEEIPNLLIISDMEFDHATSRKPNEKLFKIIEAKFNKEGYKMPKLIFWNVNSRTDTIPVKQNELGVILVSGFSPAIIKMVLSEELDPYKALLKQLMSERYSQITLKS